MALALTEFFDRLPIRSAEMAPAPNLAVSTLGGGQVLTAQVAPTLWRGTLSLAPMGYDAADAAAARISSLLATNGRFFVTTIHRAGPASDPDGAVVAGASPKISGRNAAGQVSFSGLPGGYELRAGDLFALDFQAGGGTLHALHQIAADVSAGGGGSTALVDVVPALQPAVSTGTAVRFRRPACAAVIDPGSVRMGASAALFRTGTSFGWVQDLRP